MTTREDEELGTRYDQHEAIRLDASGAGLDAQSGVPRVRFFHFPDNRRLARELFASQIPRQPNTWLDRRINNGEPPTP